MTNLNHVVEFLAAFFLGITALLVLMVRLEASLSPPAVAERLATPLAPPEPAPSTVAVTGEA